MRILLAVLLLLLLFFQYQLWFSRGGLVEMSNLREEIAEQEAENAELRARNEALEAEVQDLREGLDAVEERARSEIGLIGPEERFYEVIEIDRPLEALDPESAGWPDPSSEDEAELDIEVGEEVLIPPIDPEDDAEEESGEEDGNQS